MPRSRDFLERFRPSGTPGAAAGVGVPADHVAERAVELGPIFQRLEDAEAEVNRMRAAAAEEAERRRAEAAERARALVAGARREAEAEHADAAAQVRRQVEAEASRVLATTREEADDLQARAAERMPVYVERVLAAVRAEIGSMVGPEPP